MTRFIFIYGLISGAIICALILVVQVIDFGRPPHSSVWLGYLLMLVGLSAILVGVKQYRDEVLGGAITFWRALACGLGIAVLAGLGYVLVWEIYLASTHYAFMGEYTQQILAQKRAAGVSGAAYQKAVAEMETLKQQYANPLFRIPMTFAEIFPVGLLVALVSATLLRNPRFLPRQVKVG